MNITYDIENQREKYSKSSLINKIITITKSKLEDKPIECNCPKSNSKNKSNKKENTSAIQPNLETTNSTKFNIKTNLSNVNDKTRVAENIKKNKSSTSEESSILEKETKGKEIFKSSNKQNNYLINKVINNIFLLNTTDYSAELSKKVKLSISSKSIYTDFSEAYARYKENFSIQPDNQEESKKKDSNYYNLQQEMKVKAKIVNKHLYNYDEISLKIDIWNLLLGVSRRKQIGLTENFLINSLNKKEINNKVTNTKLNKDHSKENDNLVQICISAPFEQSYVTIDSHNNKNTSKHFNLLEKFYFIFICGYKYIYINALNLFNSISNLNNLNKCNDSEFKEYKYFETIKVDCFRSILKCNFKPQLLKSNTSCKTCNVDIINHSKSI